MNDEKKPETNTNRELVRAALTIAPAKAVDIATATGLDARQVGQVLTKLKADGEAVRTGHLWSLADPDAKPTRGKRAAKKRKGKRVSRGARDARIEVDKAAADEHETDFNFMIDSDGDLALCHRESGSDPVWIDGKSARRLRDFLNRADELLAA